MSSSSSGASASSAARQEARTGTSARTPTSLAWLLDRASACVHPVLTDICQALQLLLGSRPEIDTALQGASLTYGMRPDRGMTKL